MTAARDFALSAKLLIIDRFGSVVSSFGGGEIDI
jgi:hypothetical protein